MATKAVHSKKSSTSSLKDALSTKNTNSLVSVRLSSKSDHPAEDEHSGDGITMHFPDETEIARSSMGSSVGGASFAEEEDDMSTAQEVKSGGDLASQRHVSSIAEPKDSTVQPRIVTHRVSAKEASRPSSKKTMQIDDATKARLSYPQDGSTATTNSMPEDIPSITEDPVHEDTSPAEGDPAQEDIPLTPGIAQFEDEQQTPKPPASQRTSKVRFDIDKINTEPIQISPTGVLHEQDDTRAHERDSLEPILSPDIMLDESLEAELARSADRSRRESETSEDSNSELVDWQELDRTEGEERRDDATDESMAFLLARLEKENNALAIDPKANIKQKEKEIARARGRTKSGSRPPSLHMIKKLVNEPTKPQLRYSLLPTPPPMTELEFWSALVRDYPTTAQRLPTLTSNKIRSGIPPPLRGVVWQSIAGARDPLLEDEYIRLSVESSPYEKMIHKDVGRSFPGVDMFRDPNGQGQRMLSKVLNAFSLFDQEIGYCQGLGFVVGPLLMHMGDKEAFCVLVRLMEHYDLRSCFLPSLRGLHLRIYQFQHLLAEHLPELTAHLEALKVEPLYLSQWFLSFFGVTCPLPMLIRIYDIILTEGASETLMRVALSLMRRNAPKILKTLEFEDIMHLLLSRSLWDTYGYNADDLVNDFVGWTGLVTRERLEALEASFTEKEQSNADKPGIHSAASKFLGRFWSGNNVSGKTTATPTLSMPIKNNMTRTPSKQSVASTLNSVESSEGHISTSSTAATSILQDVGGDDSKAESIHTMAPSVKSAHQDKDLHSQIEDLLIALSDMQREHSALADDLQQEREQREEDKAAVIRVLGLLTNEKPAMTEDELAKNEDDQEDPFEALDKNIKTSISELEAQFTSTNKRSSLALQTKQQLREEASRWKSLYSEEAIRTATLTTQLNEKDRDAGSLKDELRQARARIADSHREQQRIEKVNQELKYRKSMAVDPASTPTPPLDSPRNTSPANGLRELRLGRTSTGSSGAIQPAFSRRASSLVVKEVLSTENHTPPTDDSLLHELVNAKTAEAVARQELEEVKAKLDSLRKLMNLNTGGGHGHGHTASVASLKSMAAPMPIKQEPKKETATPSSYTAGGFFSGWGKRTTSGAS